MQQLSGTRKFVCNESHESLLIGMDYLMDGKAVTIASVVEQILGDSKNIIYSKLKAVVSDTESAQINADRIIVYKAKLHTSNHICLIPPCIFSFSGFFKDHLENSICQIFRKIQ